MAARPKVERPQSVFAVRAAAAVAARAEYVAPLARAEAVEDLLGLEGGKGREQPTVKVRENSRAGVVPVANDYFALRAIPRGTRNGTTARKRRVAEITNK